MNEDDFLELLDFFMPESVEGWLAAGMIVCAVLAAILPEPDEKAHPAWKFCHKAIQICGMGAGKMKAAGRLGKLTGIWRKK